MDIELNLLSEIIPPTLRSTSVISFEDLESSAAIESPLLERRSYCQLSRLDFEESLQLVILRGQIPFQMDITFASKLIGPPTNQK
jgi:hypothetical protein